MSTVDFEAQLAHALKEGRAASRTQGTSIRAIVSRLMESGETGPVEVLRAVMEERGEAPAWLSLADDHEVNRVLTTWGSVKLAMAEWRRANR